MMILLGGKLVLTELNNTKARLLELAREAELERALLLERKLLVDMLTHEVRTPLGSIRLAINSIKKYFHASNGVDTKRFNNINQSLKNIDDIIEHCSLMNQIDQHALEVNLACVNLNDFTKQYAAAQDDASLNRLHFHLQEQITINSDSYILKIIFTNLIENALKYSPDESTIHIDLRMSEQADKNVLINVTNQLNPKNIPDLNHIFDRYYRSAAVKNITGTGLGLYLSLQLSTRLGGQLTAFIEDETITFSLSLDRGETI
jgi:signal transduction histidine kinase